MDAKASLNTDSPGAWYLNDFFRSCARAQWRCRYFSAGYLLLGTLFANIVLTALPVAALTGVLMSETL